MAGKFIETFVENEEQAGNNSTVPTTPQPQVNNFVTHQASSISNRPGMIYCSRCGAELKADARYCMKCGQLNFSNPQNESMKKYVVQSTNRSQFQLGIDNNVEGVTTGFTADAYASNNEDSKSTKTCLIVNSLIHIILGLIVIFMFAGGENGSFLAAIIGVFIVVLIFLYNYGMQKVYIYSDEPWWSYWVPLYGQYILCKIVFRSGWMFLLNFVPLISGFFSLVILYKIGKRFKRNPVLTMFFPFVVLPMIVFDKNVMNDDKYDPTYLGEAALGKTKSEKTYGLRRLILGLIVAVIACIVLYFTWDILVSIWNFIYDFVTETIKNIQNW